MNKDDKRRCEILGIPYPPQYGGGVEHFEGATYVQLRTLLEENFAEHDSAQNFSPEFEQFVRFLAEHPLFTAHGYIVSPTRADYRVTIEGIAGPEDSSKDAIEDFVMLCRDADEFSLHPPYSWWD